MTDSITLRGMRFHTLVGLLPHEAKFPQPLELDVTAYISLRRVGESDAPAMRLDYRTLYQVITDTVNASAHHKLLEALCEKIARATLALEGVERVRVSARKPHAPITGPLDSVEVTIERERDRA